MDPISIALGLAQLVPMVAGWVAGPKAKDNAQKVVDIASSVVPNTPPDKLAEALKANPDKLLEFQKAVAEQNNAVIAAVLADIQDARGTMTKLAGMGSSLAWGAAIVSMLVIAANVLATYLVFTTTVPKGQGDLAYLIVGQLLGMGSTVVAFWLGSSMSSVQKTDMLRR